MKNQEQKQIEAQIETIESLNKKVDHLEKELEKCLNPSSDSDTTRERKINKSVFYLMEDVLEPLWRESLYHFVAFRDAIFCSFDTKTRNEFFTDADFIYGIRILNKVIDRCYQISEDEGANDAEWGFTTSPAGSRDYQLCRHTTSKIVLGGLTIDHGREQWLVSRTHDGFIKLFEAFNAIVESKSILHPFPSREDGDITEEVRAILKTIVSAQKTVLDHINATL